ncbi:hypothetical protein ECTHROOPD_3269 [Escherichia coli ThroopD]|nr:hypothetical protein ECTHROOPD_3269 [Escherichia coli ThroopD]
MTSGVLPFFWKKAMMTGGTGATDTGKTPCKCNTDAFALLSCPTPETGKSKFSPLPAFLQ